MSEGDLEMQAATADPQRLRFEEHLIDHWIPRRGAAIADDAELSGPRRASGNDVAEEALRMVQMGNDVTRFWTQGVEAHEEPAR
jgi:hypothetical protein